MRPPRNTASPSAATTCFTSSCDPEKVGTFFRNDTHTMSHRPPSLSGGLVLRIDLGTHRNRRAGEPGIIARFIGTIREEDITRHHRISRDDIAFAGGVIAGHPEHAVGKAGGYGKKQKA